MIWFRETIRKIMRRDAAIALAVYILLVILIRSVTSSYGKSGGGIYAVLSAFFLLLTPAITYLDIDRTAKTAMGSDPLHKNRQLAENGLYGTAKLEYPWEYRSYAQIRPIDQCVGIILGRLTEEDGSQCIDYFPDPEDPKAHANSHIFAIGNSGSGKTYTFGQTYCYQQIKLGKSVIHTDPKGELYRDMANTYIQHGYIVKRLNFINPDKSDSWDCLKSIKEEPRPGQKAILAMVFADAVISNTMGLDPTNVHVTAGKLLLQALILRLVLDTEIKDEEKTIKKVYAWLTEPGKMDFMDALFDPRSLPEEQAPSIAYYGMFKNASKALAGNILTDLQSAIQILGSGNLPDILSQDDIDLSLPGEKPCAYFVQFPIPNSSYKFPVALFFSMLFRTLQDKAINSKNGKLNREVCFMLDEFAQCGKLPDWETYMSAVRSFGLNVFMIIQTISQFTDLYGEASNTIVSACAVWLMISANDPITAKFFSDRCGEASFISESESRQGIRKMFGMKNSPVDRSTEGTGHGKLFTPDEIMKIPPNQALVMLQKHNAVLCYTVPHLLHPYSKEEQKTLNENCPDFSDTETRNKKNKENFDFSERYWKTHKEFKVPDNIRDAPYETAPTIWGEMVQVISEDLKIGNYSENKSKASSKTKNHSAPEKKKKTTDEILLDESENSFEIPDYVPLEPVSNSMSKNLQAAVAFNAPAVEQNVITDAPENNNTPAKQKPEVPEPDSHENQEQNDYTDGPFPEEEPVSQEDFFGSRGAELQRAEREVLSYIESRGCQPWADGTNDDLTPYTERIPSSTDSNKTTDKVKNNIPNAAQNESVCNIIEEKAKNPPDKVLENQPQGNAQQGYNKNASSAKPAQEQKKSSQPAERTATNNTKPSIAGAKQSSRIQPNSSAAMHSEYAKRRTAFVMDASSKKRSSTIMPPQKK